MTTALITHKDCLNHVTPAGHPECVARLEEILETLSASEFDPLLRVEAPLATDADLLLVHPQTHIDTIRSVEPGEDITSVDPDTHMSPGSLNAALRGVGANVKAVDMVLSGEVANAFCAIRPPGHHAEKTTAMGFCLFGNIAIAAMHAIERHGLSRVAIIDFDVHHGNGTQDLLWDEARILFVSSHQMPLYPGTGHSHETGTHGQILNIPLQPGTNGTGFRAKMEALALPAIDAQRPELILISAGFDAHRADPLANLNLSEEDFIWITEKLCDLADLHCQGRIVSTLEGGYDLQSLAASTAAHVKTLMERGA